MAVLVYHYSNSDKNLYNYIGFELLFLCVMITIQTRRVL